MVMTMTMTTDYDHDDDDRINQSEGYPIIVIIITYIGKIFFINFLPMHTKQNRMTCFDRYSYYITISVCQQRLYDDKSVSLLLISQTLDIDFNYGLVCRKTIHLVCMIHHHAVNLQQQI